MPFLTITKTYLNGNTLFQVDLDNICNSISTLLNTTLLDYQNIQTGGLLGTNLANGTIANAQLGSACVNTANLASSAVTAAILAPNVMTSVLAATTSPVQVGAGVYPTSTANAWLNGVTNNSISIVDANSPFSHLPITVSANTSQSGLKIVRGAVTSAGALSFGEGFTSSKTGTGQYTITYSTAFFDSPALIVNSLSSATVANASTNSVNATIQTYNSSFAAADSAFYFIAIGQRGAG